MYKTPARRLFPALCALLLAFAACKNPIIAEWYREDDDKNQNQSSASAPQTPQSAVLQRVNDLALTYNVPAPYGGETPVRSFAGPQYEGRVDWSVSGGGAHNGPFVTGTAYTALVNMVSSVGWTFDGVAENSFAHLGGAGAAVRNAAGTGTALLVIIEFAPAENALPVDDLNLTFYVPAPETGGIPALSLAGPQYTGVVSWSSGGGPYNGIFLPGTVYTATVTMQAASGRTFNGVGQDAFRHWAAGAAVSNNADSGVVSIVFPATGPGEPVSSIDLTAYIRRAVAGAERTSNFRTAVCYGTVEWELDGAPMPEGFFLMDKVYTAKVTLFPVRGYVFADPLTVTHGGNTMTPGPANPVQAEVSISFDTTILRLAAGGDVSLQWTGVPGYYYETHVFKTAGTYSLSFIDPLTPSVIADYLIVAGGGGAGSACPSVSDKGGGGGAGGLLHKAGQTLALSGGSVAITVGAGGAGGAGNAQGADGGNSAIGGITVPGGGGGGMGIGQSSNADASGKDGGSGGGSGALAGYNKGAPGYAAGGDIRGNMGGWAGTDNGGGGGGAGGPGGTAAGGAPWKPSAPENNGWEWVEALTGTAEFSRGGRGGLYTGGPDGAAGVNYGDGGDGRNGKGAPGMAGHHGIVIIRFLNPGYNG